LNGLLAAILLGAIALIWAGSQLLSRWNERIEKGQRRFDHRTRDELGGPSRVL